MFFGVVVASSFASDSVLATTLEDDRVLHQLDALYQGVAEEVQYVFSTDDDVWRWMVNSLGCNVQTLRMESS
jgi:hypothetical protein